MLYLAAVGGDSAFMSPVNCKMAKKLLSSHLGVFWGVFQGLLFTRFISAIGPSMSLQ